MSLACKFILLVSVLCCFFFSVPPAITNISGNQSVTEADNVTLNCEAAVGNPEPRITWTKVSDNSVVTFPLVISRRDQGYFRCTADNGVGNPATKDVFVTVHCECSRILLTRHNCTLKLEVLHNYINLFLLSKDDELGLCYYTKHIEQNPSHLYFLIMKMN